MGYENENIGEPLTIDIETMAGANAAQLITAPKAPGNYKDPEKIAEYEANALANAVDNAALNIFANQVISIGTWTESAGANIVIAKTRDEERFHLAALGLLISNNGYRRPTVTFNGRYYDLPCIQIRALIHKLDFPKLDLFPAWKSPHIDLMDLLTFGGKFPKQSLDFYCRVFGIDTDESEDVKAIHGRDVRRLVAEGRWDLIESHCRYDVTRTGLLHNRIKKALS
jgi:uncharacterized protein YprB with RNaseH-like and TPR domain